MGDCRDFKLLPMGVRTAGGDPREPDEPPDVFARKPAHGANRHKGLDEHLGVSFFQVPIGLAGRLVRHTGQDDTFIRVFSGFLSR